MGAGTSSPPVYQWVCAHCRHKNPVTTQTCANAACGKRCPDAEFVKHVAKANEEALLGRWA